MVLISKRRLILMCAIVIVAIAGPCVMAVRSYHIVHGWTNSKLEVFVYRGEIQFFVMPRPPVSDNQFARTSTCFPINNGDIHSFTYAEPVSEEDWFWNIEKFDMRMSWRFCGAWHAHIGNRDELWSLPVWYLLAPPIILLAHLARKPVRRYVRSRNGACLVCGYDLRATPQRCPECGTIPSSRGSTRSSSG